MAFLTEAEPARGLALPVADGIRRIVAPNPTPMTYHGTNTYLIDGADGTVILDPGPDDAGHVQAILTATGGRVARILLSHTHHDHLGALPALQAATGATVAAFHANPEVEFRPEQGLRDGDVVEGWTALHTPGHAPDHLCFAREGVVFSADHVMGWSTSVVGPPNGNMADYFASLRRMLARDDRIYLPGHGPALSEPGGFVQAMLDHRLQREAAIEAILRDGPRDTAGLVAALYSQVNPVLRRAAERNVMAHLLKLRGEGRAVQDGLVWRVA